MNYEDPQIEEKEKMLQSQGERINQNSEIRASLRISQALVL